MNSVAYASHWDSLNIVVHAIHTAVPGRARYRVDELYHSSSLKQALEVCLSGSEGIQSVSANAKTGTVLITFNGDHSPSTITTLVESLIAEHTNGHRTTANGASHTAQRRSNRSHPPEERNPPHAPTMTTTVQQNLTAGLERLQRLLQGSREQPASPWHTMTVKDVLQVLRTSATSGLASETAGARLRTYGPNALSESEPRSTLEMLFDQVNSLPVGLLTVAAGISVATGGLADAAVILGVVAINATIGYTTESQSEKTIQSLKNLVRPTAQVVRNRHAQDLSVADLVPGDLLLLKPGSYIPADSRLLEAQRLSVDESTLTGESLPVRKTVEPLDDPHLPLADRSNMVYMGTLVTGGQGRGVTVATGRYSEIGKIQALAGEAEAPQTPLERQLDELGRQLVLISGAVCAGVFGIGILRGYALLTMLKTSISLAVAAVPEGLPTVATTTLALGIRNMHQHHVLIRRLAAVETLGAVQAICLDKTGTLTLNRMAVVAAHVGMRRVDISDDGLLVSGEPLDLAQCPELTRLAHVGVLCSETEIEHSGEDVALKGSPTENALIHLAMRLGVDAPVLRAAHPQLQVSLRAENRNFMTTVHESRVSSNGTRSRTVLVAVKGSPSEVLAMCAWQLKDGQRIQLTDSDRLVIEAENERMAGEALRVLGCAYFEGRKNGMHAEAPSGLTWIGLVGMADPLRPGVKEVIAQFHQAGIETIMITGDQSATAYAIGKELALARNTHVEILDSTHLANLDPDVLKALAAKVDVFARVSPAHKLQIVQALQRAGKVVAMTGDGINDGPALKAADIGIAMGHAGTDVAREVADVILEDDNLATMIVAIGQGRTLYDNIRKAVRFLLSTNLSEIIVTATATALGVGQPLNAMQLLWINLLSDVAPGLALALEPPEADVLSRPPRSPIEPIVKPTDFWGIAREAGTISAGALSAYVYGLSRYGIGPQASTLAFTSLTTSQILHALTSRSERWGLFHPTGVPANPYLTAAVAGSFVLQGLTLLVPGLRSLLGLTPLSVLDGLVIGTTSLAPFLVNEATKSSGTNSATEVIHAEGLHVHV